MPRRDRSQMIKFVLESSAKRSPRVHPEGADAEAKQQMVVNAFRSAAARPDEHIPKALRRVKEQLTARRKVSYDHWLKKVLSMRMRCWTWGSRLAAGSGRL